MMKLIVILKGLVEKPELLLREYIRLFLTAGTPKDSSKAFASILNELNPSGILKSNDAISRFFRISVQCCVNGSIKDSWLEFVNTSKTKSFIRFGINGVSDGKL